jgi:DNA-binding transcriptional ArsR family regulator
MAMNLHISPNTAAESARLDRTFHALADSTRRRILQRLSKGPSTVSEVAEPFDMSLAAVSQHLSVLENAGLIARTTHGRIRRCTLESRSLREADEWLNPYRAFWAGTLKALGHRAKHHP